MLLLAWILKGPEAGVPHPNGGKVRLPQKSWGKGMGAMRAQPGSRMFSQASLSPEEHARFSS